MKAAEASEEGQEFSRAEITAETQATLVLDRGPPVGSIAQKVDQAWAAAGKDPAAQLPRKKYELTASLREAIQVELPAKMAKLLASLAKEKYPSEAPLPPVQNAMEACLKNGPTAEDQDRFNRNRRNVHRSCNASTKQSTF